MSVVTLTKSTVLKKSFIYLAGKVLSIWCADLGLVGQVLGAGEGSQGLVQLLLDVLAAGDIGLDLQSFTF